MKEIIFAACAHFFAFCFICKSKRNFAFTLSELLMSVLVISVIMVAMAPVITKRVSDNLDLTSTTSQASLYEGQLLTTKSFNQNCSKVMVNGVEQDYISCKLKIPGNIDTINVIAVSGGGGGGGVSAISSKRNYLRLPEVNYKNNDSSYTSGYATLDITNAVRDVSITDARSAGGTGGGAAFANKGSAPTSQSDCDKYQALYVNGLCVMKKNAGNAYKLGETELAKMGISVISEGNTCADGENCCFTGTTSSSCASSGSWSKGSTTYSGCTRTVCFPSIADKICKQYAPTPESRGHWRIPTSSEASSLASLFTADSTSSAKFSRYLGSNGADLCGSASTSSSYGYLQCGVGTALCKNADSSIYQDCYPNVFPVNNSGSIYGYYPSASGLYNSYSYRYYPNSIRCVLDDMGSKNYSVASGGGGSGATTLIGYQLPNEILKNFVGGKIHINMSLPCSESSLLLGSSCQMFWGADYPMAYLNSTSGGAASSFAKQDEYYYYIRDFTGNAYGKETSFNIIKGTDGKNIFRVVLADGLPGSPGSIADKQGGKGGQLFDLINTITEGYSFNYGGCYAEYRLNGTYKFGSSGSGPATCERNLEGATIYYGEKGHDGYYAENANNSDEITKLKASGNGGLGYDDSHGGYHSGVTIYGTASGGDGGVVIPPATGSTDDVVHYAPVARYGDIRISYYLVYPTGGGGGGQGGNLMTIDRLSVSSVSVGSDGKKEIEVIVGKGGLGGASGSAKSSGKTGGKSGIKIGSNYLYVLGGVGGSYGTSSSSATITSSYFGAGGTRSSSTSVTEKSGYSDSIAKIVKGEAGQKGATIYEKDADGNDTEVILASHGGLGGKSATGTKGGCGGFFTNLEHCSNNKADGQTTEFSVPADIYNTSNYGQAGAGGGGGGWNYEDHDILGRGGDGQDGYVYVYWVKPN